MKRIAVCSWIWLAASALMEGQLSVPQLGVAHYADGSVHVVRGIAANLIVDSRTIATADSASFSDSAGLIAARGVIRLIRTDGTVLGEYQSGEAQPVLNIDPLAQFAAVWLPSKHLLLSWNGRQFVETPIEDSSFAGRVMSISVASSTSAQFLVGRADSSVARISVSLPSGRVTNSDTAPGAHRQVIAQQGWIVSQDDLGLTAERADGSRQTMALSTHAIPVGDLTMERMSDHWLHVFSRSASTDWAIEVTATKLSIFLLPVPVAGEAAR